MGRKYIYLFCVLAFSLFHFSVVRAADLKSIGFLWDGGMTTDSITIGKPTLEKFTRMEGTNTLKVDNEVTDAKLSFGVYVPKGKVASLRYKVISKITAKSGQLPPSTSLSFTVKLGENNRKIYHSGKTWFQYSNDEVLIPAGEHKVYIEMHYDAPGCNTIGTIENLSLHVHQYSNYQMTREAICGETGTRYAKCDVCGKGVSFSVPPANDKHDLVVQDRSKSSCLSMSDTMKVCRNCPYMTITYADEPEDHQFDANGHCSVCGLHIPKANAEGTAYEIYDAGEMRVLSELLSLGRIRGDIGIDIKNDLEFNKDIVMLPLGTHDYPFQGVLNGNGHRIRGIVNSYSGVDCLGFVGVAKGTVLSHAVIGNLIFDAGNTLQGMACVGGIVGYASECDIVNCASFGALEGTNYVGGIVGYADKQVSIINCGSVATIRTKGRWNTMACNMPFGHIQNSYGTGTNSRGGTLDELSTTTLRHCFSTQGSADGLKQVTQDVLTSYDMVQLLNEESENPCFMMSETDHYPVPVVATSVPAKASRLARVPAFDPVAASRRARAAADDETSGEVVEKRKNEVQVVSGYVDPNSPSRLYKTIAEVMSEDSSLYADFDRTYIITKSVPEGFRMGDRISGGSLMGFESYFIPADSAYLGMREYEVSNEKVKPQTEAVYYAEDDNERIDEYTADDSGAYSLTSRTSFKNDNDIVYQENVDGVLKTAWSIETRVDDEYNTAYIAGYSYDLETGETHLEFSESYSIGEGGSNTGDGAYVEYYDSLSNTIHVLYTIVGPDNMTGSREHYILRASDQYLLEIRSENMIGGWSVLTDGIYFVYDDNDALVQSVVYGQDETSTSGEMSLKMYYDYIGSWQDKPFPTSIRVPSVEKPSPQQRLDTNVYDMRGRVVRRVTDMKDPFSGLPHGVYIYQGAKYLKRN